MEVQGSNPCAPTKPSGAGISRDSGPSCFARPAPESAPGDGPGDGRPSLAGPPSPVASRPRGSAGLKTCQKIKRPLPIPFAREPRAERASRRAGGSKETRLLKVPPAPRPLPRCARSRSGQTARGGMISSSILRQFFSGLRRGRLVRAPQAPCEATVASRGVRGAGRTGPGHRWAAAGARWLILNSGYPEADPLPQAEFRRPTRSTAMTSAPSRISFSLWRPDDRAVMHQATKGVMIPTVAQKYLPRVMPPPRVNSAETEGPRSGPSTGRT